MNQTWLQTKVELFTKMYEGSIAEMYLSEHEILSHEVMDTFEKKVFGDKDNQKGYLLFIDPCPIANWSHPCHYIFLIEGEADLESVHEKWMPHETISLKQVK